MLRRDVIRNVMEGGFHPPFSGKALFSACCIDLKRSRSKGASVEAYSQMDIYERVRSDRTEALTK